MSTPVSLPGLPQPTADTQQMIQNIAMAPLMPIIALNQMIQNQTKK